MPPPTPRAKPGLSRERVLDAALAVLDREGLEALSMRRLGAELGVEAMSLYRYVPSKSALLDGLHERILAEVTPPPAARTWRGYVRHQAKALRRALLAHPNAVPLFATRPAATAASLERLDAHLGVLREAGFSPLEALHVVQCVSALVVGHALWTTGDRTDTRAMITPYAALDRLRFANVRAAAAALPRYDPEVEFARGLSAMLRGFARLARGGDSGPT